MIKLLWGERGTEGGGSGAPNLRVRCAPRVPLGSHKYGGVHHDFFFPPRSLSSGLWYMRAARISLPPPPSQLLAPPPARSLPLSHLLAPLPAAGYRLKAARRHLPAARCRLKAARRRLPAAGYRLKAARRRLPAARRRLLPSHESLCNTGVPSSDCRCPLLARPPTRTPPLGAPTLSLRQPSSFSELGQRSSFSDPAAPTLSAWRRLRPDE
nr:uncharacterized protein LOC127298945 [Lolium perenne]